MPFRMWYRVRYRKVEGQSGSDFDQNEKKESQVVKRESIPGHYTHAVGN